MVYGKFGKVEDRALILCQMPFDIGGVPYWSTDPAILNQAGYYPVVHTEPPQREGYYYTDYWELFNEQCLEKWEEHPEVVG